MMPGKLSQAGSFANEAPPECVLLQREVGRGLGNPTVGFWANAKRGLRLEELSRRVRGSTSNSLRSLHTTHNARAPSSASKLLRLLRAGIGTSRRCAASYRLGRYWRHSGHEWPRRIGQHIVAETEKWAKVIRAANIKAE
jgi:hypothetical protein